MLNGGNGYAKPPPKHCTPSTMCSSVCSTTTDSLPLHHYSHNLSFLHNDLSRHQVSFVGLCGVMLVCVCARSVLTLVSNDVLEAEVPMLRRTRGMYRSAAGCIGCVSGSEAVVCVCMCVCVCVCACIWSFPLRYCGALQWLMR